MCHVDNNLFTGLLSLSYRLAQGISTQLWHRIPLRSNIKKYNFQVPHSDFLGPGDTFLKYAPKEADV